MNGLLRPAMLVAVLACCAGAGAQSSQIQRCESKDGRVTYSNTACPDGTVAKRKVNTEPPVSVEDRKAAQERARRDNAIARQVDKEQAQQEERDRKRAEDREKAERKADAKAKDRCEAAQRELERARTSRAALNGQAFTPDKLQKAELEITLREGDVVRECAR